MHEVAASREASARDFASYVDVCLKHFPAATNVRDDSGLRLSVQGNVNVAFNEGGHELVCSVNVATRSIERVWADQRTYTLAEYVASANQRTARTALAAQDAALISSGDHQRFVTDAKRAITQNLKDPDSALFRDMFLSNKELPTLCGEMNAKNSYGGYVGYKKFFYNRIASHIDDPEPSRSNAHYQSLRRVYCGDRFADVAP
jgi:hypothetical protein